MQIYNQPGARAIGGPLGTLFLLGLAVDLSAGVAAVLTAGAAAVRTMACRG